MNHRNRPSAYVSGNNAIKMERQVIQHRVVHNEPTTRPVVRTRPRRRSNPMVSFVLVLALVVTLATTVVLLKTQFMVTDNAEQIISLKKQLSELQKVNEQLESDIQKGINMDEVYRIATEELGMVQAGQENIQYIESQDLAYTVQYGEIGVTEQTSDVNLGNILGFISKGW